MAPRPLSRGSEGERRQGSLSKNLPNTTLMRKPRGREGQASKKRRSSPGYAEGGSKSGEDTLPWKEPDLRVFSFSRMIYGGLRTKAHNPGIGRGLTFTNFISTRTLVHFWSGDCPPLLSARRPARPTSPRPTVLPSTAAIPVGPRSAHAQS